MDTGKQIIYEKIKAARAKRFLSNCYSMDVVENSNGIWLLGDEFLFSYDDHGINRLVFFAREWKEIDVLLDTIDYGRYYLEFMTKDPKKYVPRDSLLTASMLRMANPDCRSVFAEDSIVLPYKNTERIDMAKESDADEINEILWTTFHTEISHLLSDEELIEKIREGQISIHRDQTGHIDALLQADVMPKKFYINQVVNRSDRHVIHAIVLNRLEQYITAGGKYLYAWVEEKNIASLKFHEKYGMRHDGMWSMIYSLEK
jgi:hypothetical protein